MKEQKTKKEKWQKPELTILIKGLPEEDVLGCCKASPETCQNESVSVSLNCS